VYRSRQEVEEWQGRDPLPRFRRALIEHGISDGEIEEKEGEVFALVDEAVIFARQAAPAKVEDALVGVYGDTHNGLVF